MCWWRSPFLGPVRAPVYLRAKRWIDAAPAPSLPRWVFGWCLRRDRPGVLPAVVRPEPLVRMTQTRSSDRKTERPAKTTRVLTAITDIAREPKDSMTSRQASRKLCSARIARHARCTMTIDRYLLRRPTLIGSVCASSHGTDCSARSVALQSCLLFHLCHW